MSDPFQLERFVAAQAPIYDEVLAELRAGEKSAHWMWFIFPQLRELGRSAVAKHYGIGPLAAVTASLAPRLPPGRRMLAVRGACGALAPPRLPECARSWATASSV